MIVIAVAMIFDIVEYLILAYVILSWFVRSDDNPLMRMIGLFVDPIFIPIRALTERLGFRTGMLDFTPLFAILVLRLVRYLVLKLLVGLLF